MGGSGWGNIDMKNGEGEQSSFTDAADAIKAGFGHSSTLEDTAAPPAVPPAPATRQPGEKVGRYVIQRFIAWGGMGAIYSAWDPQLGRQVALKLLRSEHASRHPLEAGMRLQREAQAIARLSHPNVVAVYDTGLCGNEVFVAMELVEGGTLRTWLNRGRRSWREVLEVFLAAGRGLEAAHAAGLVHRDFKPDNVLIGKDGRVRVADFGLARAVCAVEAPTEESDEDAAPEASSVLFARTITCTGTLVGTPHYMAPEQFHGAPLDARSDQFSFSVTLYQALYGGLPFGKGNPEELVPRMVAGEVRPPPRKTSVPGWITPVLLRGLRSAPEERFASMTALLQAIDPRPHGRRRRWGTVAVVWAVILGAAFGYGYYASRRVDLSYRIPQHRKVTLAGNVSETAISPTGRRLAYVLGGETLVLLDLKTGEAQERFYGKEIQRLRWSPVGEQLLFWAADGLEEDGQWLLSEKDLRPVKLNPVAAWSPDGLTIAHARPSGKEIWLTRLQDGSTRRLSLSGAYEWITDLDWSPEGERLLVEVQYRRRFLLWTLRVDGRGRGQQLPTDTENLEPTSPRWSRRGNSIFWLKRNQDTSDLVKTRLATTAGQLATRPETLLTGLDPGLNLGGSLSITHDGKRLAYIKNQNHSNLWLVSVVSVDGQGEQRIPHAVRLTSGTVLRVWPSVSPDGQNVAFVALVGGVLNLFIVPVAGGPQRQLTFFGLPRIGIQIPAWSPDGKEIAFIADTGGVLRVWRIPASGGVPEPFSRSEVSESTMLTWAPGYRILYQRPGNRNFHFLDPKTEEESPLMPHEAVGRIFCPRYSPDGREVAVLWNRDDGPELWSVHLSAGTQRRLGAVSSSRTCPLGWSTDGQWVYAADLIHGRKEILRLPAAGGEPERWVTLPFTQDVTCTAMTANGQRFVCAVDEGEADAWLVEDFDDEPALAAR